MLTRGASYTSNTVSISEGEPLTQKFTVNTSSAQRYVLSNPNIDTTSIKVRIQTSAANTSKLTWAQASNLVDVQANSAVYFIQENEDGKYELLFGDDVLGQTVDNGNIVIADYRVVNGSVVTVSYTHLTLPTTD